MGCCGSKNLSEEEVLTKQPKKKKAEPLAYKAHTIELSDYEYSYTYTDSDDPA